MEAAPDGDGARLYRLAGTAGEVAKLAGEILGEIGKAGLGVVAGVGLVRTLRKLLLRKDEQPPEAPAGDVLTIAVTIGPEKKPDGPTASAALKELKEAADGLTALGKLLARGS